MLPWVVWSRRSPDLQSSHLSCILILLSTSQLYFGFRQTSGGGEKTSGGIKLEISSRVVHCGGKDVLLCMTTLTRGKSYTSTMRFDQATLPDAHERGDPRGDRSRTNRGRARYRPRVRFLAKWILSVMLRSTQRLNYLPGRTCGLRQRSGSW